MSMPRTDIGDSASVETRFIASDRTERTHAVCPYSHADEYKNANTAAIISQPYTHNATNIAGLRRLGFPLSTVERGSGGEVKRVNGVRSNYSDFYSLNI